MPIPASAPRPRPDLRASAGLGIVLLLAAAGLAVAQAPASEPPAFSEEVSVGWVLVPVVVRGPDGYVEGLRREDFQLAVDGRPLPIHTFERRAEAPVSLVLLQDVSGSMGVLDKLSASRRALSVFLDRARPGDEIALASFAGGMTAVDVPFTGEIDVLREAMAAWEAWGTTALHDAIGRLPEIARAANFPKRAAVLVTDGVDNASRISAVEARELVRRAELPVYVLGLSTGDPYALAGPAEKLFRFADALNLLASLTGGRYYSLSGPADLAEVCAAIADELRLQYVLSFPTSARGSSSHHRIEVRIPGRADLRVLARKGYEGTAPAN